ncbi:hypothetical protein SLEP1_g5305 [Rubroshorea leprosula]|uniref:Uncharacterized protein n=2 Tax=Rubroshorea leprosula TaxID=152421 RepID=A0AAV5HZF1_9ROSI|nr:hypothetical protein SLEP1_g5305 [Rubroshorea leprosula]
MQLLVAEPVFHCLQSYHLAYFYMNMPLTSKERLHLLCRFYVAPTPRRMGYAAAAERFIKVMAMVWAGSQVTKLIRAGGALTLAPIVDRGLSWFTTKFKFESQGKAFMAIIVLCFGLAMMLFFVVTLLWA